MSTWGRNPTVTVHFFPAVPSERAGGSRQSGRRRAWGSVTAENQRSSGGPDSRSKEASQGPIEVAEFLFVFMNMKDEQPSGALAGSLLAYVF